MGYLKEKSDKMNAYHFTSLHYTNSLGTDLHIGLNPDYKWLNAHETSLLGHQFMANMPSEEVLLYQKNMQHMEKLSQQCLYLIKEL